MKSMKSFIKLDNKVSIYVPSTVNINQIVDNQELVRKTLIFLSLKFGGATSIEGRGSWLNEHDKTLVLEKVMICSSFTTKKKIEESISDLKDYCQTLKKDYSQQSVGMEINDVLYLL